MSTAFKQLANNAVSATSTSFAATGVVSTVVTTGTGTKFPAPGNGFYATIWTGAVGSDPGADANAEIVTVTAKSTDTFTHSATTKTHAAPVNFALLNVAANISDIQTAVNTLEGQVIGSLGNTTSQVPTGTVDGVNAAYTTSAAYVANSLEVYVDGIHYIRGTDYTETTPGSGIFTMATAPAVGQDITVNYQTTTSAAGNADTVDSIHATTTATANTLVALDASKLLPASGVTAPSTDHLKLSAGTSKLVKLTVLRQDDTTNTYQVGNSVMLTGWGVVVPGVASSAIDAVTFGVTFLQRPIVVVTQGGDAASATTYGSGGNTIKSGSIGQAHSVTTTGFSAQVSTRDSSNWSAGNAVFYQWMAIGEIA